MEDPRFFLQWIRATFLGWLLGVPLIAGFALLGEAVGIGGAQSLVGAGMGTGLGLMQGRLMRRRLGAFLPWLMSSAIGLTVAFLPTDLMTLAGFENPPYSVYICVIAGGLISAIWQAMLLRRRFARAGWWVAASLAGWALASAVAGIGDSLLRSHSVRGIPGALAYLGLIALGGPVLGAVTGTALVRALHPRAASPPAGA